jgi:hypothetical protein
MEMGIDAMIEEAAKNDSDVESSVEPVFGKSKIDYKTIYLFKLMTQFTELRNKMDDAIDREARQVFDQLQRGKKLVNEYAEWGEGEPADYIGSAVYYVVIYCKHLEAENEWLKSKFAIQKKFADELQADIDEAFINDLRNFAD